MAVLKYKDPITGEIKKVGTPIIDAYSKEEANVKFAPSTHASQHQSPNVILWDGDETGHTVVVDPTSSSTIYVHVSDVVPTKDEIFDNPSAFGVAMNGIERHKQTTQDLIEVTDDGLIIVFGLAIVPSDNFVDTTYELTFAKKGIYFAKADNMYISYFYLSGVTLTAPSDPLTAEIIGASQASHEHNAEAITGGRFGNAVYAGESYQTPSYSLLRNIKVGTADLEAGVSTLATGEMYFVYE